MRRLIVEEPMSRFATWAPRLGWVALAAFLLAGVLTRFGRLELDTGLTALAAACALAGLAILCAIVGFARIWSEGQLGFGRALGGFVLALLVLAYPAALGARFLVGPPFLDVSTDPTGTLGFSAEASAARDGWHAEPLPPGLRLAQRAARPGFAGLDLPLLEDVAFGLAVEAAERRGFRIIETTPPGESANIGRIEATARSLVLRVPVEVTIRVRPTPRGSRVDVRAVTRAPVEDLGGAPETIVRYVREIDERASVL